MTTAYQPEVSVFRGVYAPQEDSLLLIDTMERLGVAQGARVADLCTGSGVVALSAAAQGAAAVTAFDISPAAVRCARLNASNADARVDVHLGSWARAREFGPFDVVVSNPPYVPHGPGCDQTLSELPEARAWDAGLDGRLILDPLCDAAAGLLVPGGTLLVVHSEFSDIERSVRMLRSSGMTADIVARQRIPFGPVLLSRAQWLEEANLLAAGRRTEDLVVVRARKK